MTAGGMGDAVFVSFWLEVWRPNINGDKNRLHSHGRRKSGAALVLPQQKSAERLLGLFGWFRFLDVLFSGHCPLPTTRYRLVPVGVAIASRA